MMMKSVLSICLVSFLLSIDYAIAQDAMDKQEKFINDFLKNNDKSESRIKSDAIPNISDSDGFIRINTPVPRKTAKPQIQPPKDAIKGINPWTGKAVPKKPSLEKIIPQEKPDDENKKPAWDWENYKGEAKRTGSGFIINASGYVVTNHHVTLKDKKILVKTVLGKFPAKIVASDEENDIAVLKVTSDKTFSAMPLSSDNEITSGTAVFTIGFPMPSIQGFQPKVSRGIISSTSGIHDDSRHYQTDVQIQPGNSGGVLANMNGHVIGIIRSTLSSSTIYNRTGVMPQNVNYAIKSYLLLELLKREKLNDIVTFASNTNETPEFKYLITKCTNSVVMILIY